MPRVASRLAAFALILAGSFGTAYAVGERLPGATPDPESIPHTHPSGGMATPVAAGYEQRGYQLVTDNVMSAMDGMPGVAGFHLLHPDGSTVTEFDRVHEKLLHAIVVRPDLSEYHHVHPQVREDGSWTLTLPGPGQWHLVFDSTPSGETAPIVVSANIDDEQPVATVPLPPPADTVELDGLVISRARFDFTVTDASGAAVTGLETYLGQPAHLVAIRQGDLAYTHLHPNGEMDGMFTFGEGINEPGTYRLFLEFGYRGEVLLATFTVVVP
jgi:hypothetical protein